MEVCDDVAIYLADCLEQDLPETLSSSCNVKDAEYFLNLSCTEIQTHFKAPKGDSQHRELEDFRCSLGYLFECPIQECRAEIDEVEDPPEATELLESSTCASDALQWLGCEACSYYLCRELSHPCGVDGYFVRFGYPYCMRFRMVTESRVSAEGKAWLIRVRRCLIEALEPTLAWSDCDAIEEEAYATHMTCYAQTGFCDLATSDWLKVYASINPDDRRFLDLLSVGVECLKEWFSAK
jgi:hypothetical protein